MATAEQLKALLESHTEGDSDRFLAVAMQMAAHAARRGQGKLADDLRRLIDRAKAVAASSAASPRRPVPIAAPRGELAALLVASYPKARLGDMVLDAPTRARIARILDEVRQQHKLRAHGVTPRRKILLIGPPGTGKTMTASVLAGELGLPLLVVQLDGLITKFMGETAAKLRLVFDAMERSAGVYLFDEFDAIGTERGAPNDVGEIRRVLNSFLQFLEQDQSAGLVVAATNHVGALDRALFRRFDDVLEYTLPTASLAEEALQNRLAGFAGADVSWHELAKAASGLSYAEIARSCEEAIKTAILADAEIVTNATVVAALAERRVIAARG